MNVARIILFKENGGNQKFEFKKIVGCKLVRFMETIDFIYNNLLNVYEFLKC